MTKFTIIEQLIDFYVNPSWHGNKANDARVDWKKSLNKCLKKDLLIQLNEFKLNL